MFAQAAASSSAAPGYPALRVRNVHTHYDNLKVTRDAPPEVIRAAYRALSRKYHPDRRADDDQAARVMQLLNAAYEVLSDPDRRRAHDEWIAQAQAGVQDDAGADPSRYPAEPSAYRHDYAERPRRRVVWVLGLTALGGVLLVVAGVFLRDEIGLRAGSSAMRPPPGPTAGAANPTPHATPYVRRPLAPNGMTWPDTSGYVEGYAKLRTDGMLAVLVDNSRNRADVFAKLVALEAGQPTGLRAIFVKAGERFSLDGMRPGTYEIRYRDLDTGIVSRSSQFILQEFSSDAPNAPDAPDPPEEFVILLPGPHAPGVERPQVSDSEF